MYQSSAWPLCYSGFHHTRWITHCMAFPYPAADSLFPMDHLFSFDVSLTIPKNIRKMIYASFSPITAYIRRYYLYSRVHRDLYIIQNPLERSLTWIRLIWLLAFHMPWDRTDSTFQYQFGKLYKEPLRHWKKRRKNWEYQNYSPLLPELYLSLHPFVPLEHCCALPKLAFASELAIERWRIEVVEAQVGDSVSLIRRRAVKGCIYLVISDLY